MGLLDNILGNQQTQQELQGYVQRYKQGSPSEGYSDQEVAQRYQQIAPQLPAQDFQRAAEQAFNNMPPDQRQQFGQSVEQQLQARGASTPGFNQGQTNAQQYQDPGYLAQQTAQLHQQQPQLLSQLFGGDGGGSGGALLSNPAVKSALAGIAANAISNAMGGGRGNELRSLF